ncbi:hypothetical protein [Paenibacillus yonginensis]|uniref:hypothetical protein n=1 Tax=Paenibacillus yonginensis TaxID=1462996 RepID=UPI001F42FFEC|nr:hypothetical protein [Paenibacillus yonginensis]
MDSHFDEHLKKSIPVQIYYKGLHEQIGRITAYDRFFVEVEGTLYNRKIFTFISRPGY